MWHPVCVCVCVQLLNSRICLKTGRCRIPQNDGRWHACKPTFKLTVVFFTFNSQRNVCLLKSYGTRSVWRPFLVIHVQIWWKRGDDWKIQNEIQISSTRYSWWYSEVDSCLAKHKSFLHWNMMYSSVAVPASVPVLIGRCLFNLRLWDILILPLAVTICLGVSGTGFNICDTSSIYPDSNRLQGDYGVLGKQ